MGTNMALSFPLPRSLTSRRPLRCLLLLALVLCASSSSHAFLLPTISSCASTYSSKAPTALHYASQATSSDPMLQADGNKKQGGCPFIADSSYEYKTYAVPALFSDEDSRPIVLFDGECNLCNKFVQTLLKFDSDERGNIRFAALQSRVGDLLLRRMSDDLRNQVLSSTSLDNNNDGTVEEVGADDDEEKYISIVVCGAEKTYIRSSAVLQILQSLGGPSKRLKAAKYVALMSYVVPTRVRDVVYGFVSKRRKKWFGASDECLLWDDRFEERFVDDGVLTGVYRDPFADPKAKAVQPKSINLFEGDSPPVRGDKVQIVWPADSEQDPSVSYDNEFQDGICLTSGTGTISTIDLPMRVVMRVDRKSIGLGPDENGDETMIAWVKPQEVATL